MLFLVASDLPGNLAANGMDQLAAKVMDVYGFAFGPPSVLVVQPLGQGFRWAGARVRLGAYSSSRNARERPQCVTQSGRGAVRRPLDCLGIQVLQSTLLRGCPLTRRRRRPTMIAGCVHK